MKGLRIASGLLTLMLFAAAAAYVHARSSLEPLDDVARARAPGSFVELSEGRVHYRLHPARSGDDGAPLVVLIHGFSTPSFVFRGLVDPLTDAGRRVLTYDHYGRGYSDRPDTAYGAALYERQLLELLDAIGPQEAVELVGYSMGGAIATRVAGRHASRIDKVGLIAPAGLIVEQGDEARLLTVPILGNWLITVFGRSMMLDMMSQPANQGRALPDLLERYEEQMRYDGYLRALHRTLVDFPMRDRQEEFRAVYRNGTPVFSIWGRRDAVVPIASADELVRINPAAIVEVIDDGTHAITYSEPERVSAALVTFLTGTKPAP